MGYFYIDLLSTLLVNSLAQGVSDQISMDTYALEVGVGVSEPATHAV